MTQKTTPATIADHPIADSRLRPNATIQNPNAASDDDGAEDEEGDSQVAVRAFQVGAQSGLDRGALGRVQQSGARPLANLCSGVDPFFIRNRVEIHASRPKRRATITISTAIALADTTP